MNMGLSLRGEELLICHRSEVARFLGNEGCESGKTPSGRLHVRKKTDVENRVCSAVFLVSRGRCLVLPPVTMAGLARRL